MPNKRPRARNVESKVNKYPKTQRAAKKGRVICAVDEVSNNDSRLQQVASETTPTPTNIPVNVSGHFFEHINATENARLHLGDVYHFRKEETRIKYVDGATFDAYGQTHGACHPATRRELLQEIQAWAQGRGSKSIFWLNGMAGTGKSTISYTVATWLTQQKPFGVVDLGASFFFKRGEAGRGSAALLFPTIARQLASKIGGLDVILARAIDADPDICNKRLGEQFNKLIREPLQQLRSTHTFPTLVIVLDALDECETTDTRTLLQLWSTLPSFTNICLRLFLTSRPDFPVLSSFAEICVTVHLDVSLQDVPQAIVKDDILIFLKESFAHVRNEHNHHPWSGTPLDSAWPGDAVLQELATMATPLFIVAATVLLFVSDTNFDPRERLEIILQTRRTGQMSQIAQTYWPVLRQITASLRERTDEEKVCREFRIVVGAIVTVAEPLSRAALATLLRVPVGTIILRLQRLHSVLQIPADADAPVRPLHLSFGEYLTGKELQNGPLGVDGIATHDMLWRRCLQLLSGPDGLHENICGLSHPGQLRCEVSSAQIDKYLLPAFRYACRYWVHHIQSSAFLLSDEDEIHAFLQKHFLNWLEALSLLHWLSEAIQCIQTLQSIVAPENSLRISEFLEDARRFVLANRFVGELAPLQLYSSAIIFAPQNSIIRNICGQPPKWIRQCPIVPQGWSSELQRLEGHTKLVRAVAFSPDGRLLASGSEDNTVRLWNPSTGQEVQTLEGHTSSVIAVAFSPDGSLLASGSRDGTVRLWNPSTGQEVQTLEGHIEQVVAVAFSPDGSLLASGSWDGTVRLWNPSTGQEVQRLEGHTSWVTAVAFSPDGLLLASGSDDNTVRLWSPSTGQEVQRLKGHTHWVRTVAFSPDGLLLASGSDDNTVRLWSPSTGQEVQRLKGHTHWVRTVAFSPDGSLLASGSADNTVRLWNPSTGQEMQTLEGHTSWVTAVAFSPDGLLLASGSDDKTVRLWKPRTRQELQRLDGLPPISKIDFAIDNKTLFTNRGRIGISPVSVDTSKLEGDNRLALNHDWVEYGGYRILWLPQEYRTTVSAFYGSRFAIGQQSGLVSVLQFEFSLVPGLLAV